MFANIFKFFNIKLQKHQHLPALSCFLSMTLQAYFSPMLVKTAISELPAQWLSFETVWCCLASLLVGMLWKGKLRKNALKNYVWLALAESLAGLCLGLWLALVQWNVWVYAIFSLLYVSVISLTISRCIMVFKTKLWNEKARELHDNTASIIKDLGLMIGGICAILFCPSLKFALVLFGLCCIVDDFGWIVTWIKLKNVLKE